MDNFRSLLLSISSDIEKEQFENMKFYCKKHIGAGILERLELPIHLFYELEKRRLLGPKQKDFLADLLGNVGRQDLKNKLLGIVEIPTIPRSTVPDAPIVTGTLSETHLDEISEELPRDWKRLGRKLSMTASKIDLIDADYSRVKEKTFQLMLRWMRQNGAVATGQALADALTIIGRKDVAEHLADICKGNVTSNIQSQSSPAENIEHQDPFITMPELTAALPAPRLPTQDTKKPKKEEKGDILHADSLPDGPQHNEEPPHKPIQDTSLPTQSLGGILDPDRYFVVKQIGSGSCGKVYWCQTKDRSCNYAVKQVDLGMNNEVTQKQVKHLKKEIEILKRLRHECIVAYYYSEDTAKTLSIFMEYVRGGSIFDCVINGAIEEKRVRKYTYQLLKGCEYLHQNNVIHRDIKGANVLIDVKENIKLADFGIAKNLESIVTSTGSTTTGGFCGTIYWCSPEHFGKETPSFVFDIWSVGCTVVEMLTTKPPNRHLAHMQALGQIVNRNVHPPDHLSSMAKTFIELCFKDKDERPNATDLLNDEFPSENVPDDEN